jgi:hypothetical protein
MRSRRTSSGRVMHISCDRRSGSGSAGDMRKHGGPGRR